MFNVTCRSFAETCKLLFKCLLCRLRSKNSRLGIAIYRMDLMKRNCYLLVVANWFFVFVALANANPGHDQYEAICRTQLATTDAGSWPHFLANLKLTNALCQSDLKAALRQSEEALNLAQPLGPDAVVVAKLYVATIKGWAMGRTIAEADLQASDFELSLNASADLRFHFYSTWIAREMGARNFDEKIKPLLKSLNEFARIAAAECADPHLKAIQRSDELRVRTFWLSESPGSPAEKELRSQLQLDAQEFPFLPCRIVLERVAGLEAGLDQEISEQIAHFEKALELARETGNRWQAAICNLQLGILFRNIRNLDSAETCFENLHRVAQQLGAQPLIYEALVNLGNLERKRGNTALALDWYEQAEKSPSFSDQLFLNQHYFFQEMLSMHQNLKNRSQVRKYQQKVLSPEEARELKTSQIKADTLGVLLTNIIAQGRKDLEDLRTAHLAAEARSAARIANLKMYSIVASTLALLLLLWFVFRIRLRRVASELDTEKIHARQSEQERDDLALRLNRIQRMESLGLMAGSVAHDFNNILVGVLGNAEVIQMQTDLEDVSFVRQRVESIITSAEKAASLSRQMLAYAGKQYIARQSTDLNQLIRQYESVLRSACATTQCVDIQLCRGEIFSRVDRTQVEQVVLNLVTNAVQASPGNGKVTIRTGVETIVDIDQDPALFGTRETGGDFCFVEVQDGGHGISRQDLERIFEPFYSNSEIGRGLGLSVVYGVVKGHDGFIRCETEVDHGTTFRILLPVAVDAVGSPDPVDAGGGIENQDQVDQVLNQTVLVIDDEESVLELCTQLLSRKGWNVLTAADGTEGLTQVVDLGDEISCLLLDVVMPEMGANELLRELESRGIFIPVVLMSGFSQTKLEFFLQRPNVHSIIEKPFHATEIHTAVQRAVARADLITRTRPVHDRGRPMFDQVDH